LVANLYQFRDEYLLTHGVENAALKNKEVSERASEVLGELESLQCRLLLCAVHCTFNYLDNHGFR